MIKIRRFLALALVLSMVLSSVPGGGASALPEEDEEIIIEEMEDSPEEQEELLEESEEPEETPEEPAQEEEPLPPVYELTPEDYARKEALASHHVSDYLKTLKEGRDYEPDIILYNADSAQQAQQIADAYDAELLSYEWKMAKAALRTMSVLDALRLAEDPEAPLPAVNANVYFHVEPNHPNRWTSPFTPQSLDLPTATSWDTWVNELMEDPDEFLLDPAGEEFQWYHDTIHTYEAWGVTTGNPAIKVAVIDTGVAATNPDLRHVQYLRGEGDPDGHGTHVAGIIGAAMDNGWYGAGIAPDVSLYALQTDFANDDIARAIYIAVDAGMNLINMSLGGPYYNQVMEEALRYANQRGVTVIAACGNENSNLVNYPAAYDTVIAVASTDALGNRAFFSDYGSFIDIAAPGINIPSTYLDDFGILTGTSLSCPMVTGAAALYMSKLYETSGRIPSPAEVKAALKSAVNPVSSSGIGTGVLDISKLFSGVKTAPIIQVLKEDGEAVTGLTKTVTVDGSIKISQPDSNDALLIYTLDGRNPAVKNGTVAIGEPYTAPIDLSDLAPGSYTLKASSVSAMGVLSNIAKVTLKLQPSSHPQSIRVIAPKTMVAGKIVQLSAHVLPENANQAVSWVLMENPIGASLDGKGNLKTVPGKTGEVVVQAVSREDERCISASISIAVEPGTPAAAVTLNTKEATLRMYHSWGQKLVLLPEARDASGKPLDPETVDYRFASSNPRVASVMPDGTVTAVGSGTASITCTALDGSGKSAVCKVTVKPGMESAALSGQLGIAPGASASYKVITEPASVPGGITRWSLEDAPDGVSISSKGVVKVSSRVDEGAGFTVIAELNDGGTTRRAEQYVEICAKTKAVHIYLAGDEVPFETKENKSGWLTAATIYSTDIFSKRVYGSLYGSNTLQLGAETEDSWITPAWSSSAPGIASVDEDGMVTAHRAGTAKITCKAQDGSGKSASVTIKVITPASSIRIESDVRWASLNTARFLAYGMSAKNTAVFGQTYGTPSIQKAAWSISSIQVHTNSGTVLDYTERLQKNKMISISSSGKLTVKKDTASLISGSLSITVEAATLDGTNQTAKLTYVVDYPAKYIRLENGVKKAEMRADQLDELTYVIESDSAYPIYTVKSSNPAIAGGCIKVIDGEYCLSITAGRKAGTAKITLSTADGSSKSTVIAVTVKK